jgi:hypothetical protein
MSAIALMPKVPSRSDGLEGCATRSSPHPSRLAVYGERLRMTTGSVWIEL